MSASIRAALSCLVAATLLLGTLRPAEAQRGRPVPARPAPAAEITPGVRVAFVPLAPLGATPDEAAQATQLLGTALSEVPEVTAMGTADVARLARRPEFVRCQDAACLSRLGRALGVTRVVTGDIGALGGSYVVNLRLIDVTAGKDARQVSGPLALRGGSQEAERGARAAVVRLLAPSRYTGTLQVETDVVGATIYLDGRPVAVSPATRISGIPVGTHALRVSKEEFRDHLAFVQVNYGEAAVVNAPLRAFPVVNEEVLARRQARAGGPWYRRWYVLAAAGLIVAAAVATGIALGSGISADHTAQVHH
jgi:hypothetical protein